MHKPSTFNLYVLFIKLAQNTKQFRRLVLENFITVIYFLFRSVDNVFYGLLKHLISNMDFTAIKYSGQGSFKVKKWTIDKLLFLLKTIGILPIASVNDPWLVAQ